MVQDNEINIKRLTGYPIESEEDDKLDNDDFNDSFADTNCSIDCDNDEIVAQRGGTD